MNWSEVAQHRTTYLAPSLGNASLLRKHPNAKASAAPIEAVLDYWQATHPPEIAVTGRCLGCHRELSENTASWLHIIMGRGRVAGIHLACHATWRHHRREEALNALTFTRLTQMPS